MKDLKEIRNSFFEIDEILQKALDRTQRLENLKRVTKEFNK